MIYLSDKTWFYDVEECWKNYPYQPISQSLVVYYMLQLAYYCYSLVTQVVSNSRKRHADYWMMFFHHLIAVILISMSWCSQMHRMGCLILVTGDATNVLVELTKCAHGARKRIMSWVSLLAFTCVWFAFRLGIYPFILLPSVLLDYHHQFQSFPLFSFFKILLSVIMLFNIVWTWFILQTIYTNIYRGDLADIRSDDEEEIIEETEMENTTTST